VAQRSSTSAASSKKPAGTVGDPGRAANRKQTGSPVGHIKTAEVVQGRLVSARVKASVTLDPEVLAGVKEFAGARGVSAFINEATRLHLENSRLKELVADLIDEHGEPSAEARAAAAAMDVPW
jgi:hypothetical protein